MDDAEFSRWVAKVPTLSQTQLDALLIRVKLLPQSSSTKAGKQDFGSRVCCAIHDVLKREGVEVVSPAMLQRSSAYVSAKGKLLDLSQFFDTISDKKLVQDRILREAISLLFFDLLNWQKVPISSHTLLQQIHRIPATINRHFPGYLQSGLLTKIIKEA